MKATRHSAEDLNELREFTVPTLANAIETFGVIPSNQGFCDSHMVCRFLAMPLMVGYAVTSRVSTDQPASGLWKGVHEPSYWKFITEQPGPKIAVCKDIDCTSYGAMWGEYNSHVHKALGCIGAVVDGAVRDIDGVKDLDFHFFSTQIHPSHGNGVFIDYGGPIRVANLEIHTGDLLVGDLHGVLVVPPEISLHELAKVASEIDSLEDEIFRFCKSSHFSLDGLEKLDESVNKRWPDPRSLKKSVGKVVK